VREKLRIGYLDEAVPAGFLDARVEELARIIAPIAVRGMKRTLNEIARNKFDEAAADRRGLRRGPPFRDRSSVCRAPEIGTHAAAARPTVLPIPFCNCLPQRSNLRLSPNNASRISASGSRAFGA
jgi:hypothetical protein